MGNTTSAIGLAAGWARKEEGLRLAVYDDATGKPIVAGSTVIGNPTIGYGRLLTAANGIAKEEAEAMLQADLVKAAYIARLYLESVDCWASLDVVRQAVLVDMALNLGIRLRQFTRLKAAIMSRDWDAASAAMLDSKWADQVGARAETLGLRMRGGAAGMAQTVAV